MGVPTIMMRKKADIYSDRMLQAKSRKGALNRSTTTNAA
jgi:hypothetical protein